MSDSAPKKDKKKEQKQDEDLVHFTLPRASKTKNSRKRSTDTANDSSTIRCLPFRNSKTLFAQPPLPWPASPNPSNSSKRIMLPSSNITMASPIALKKYPSLHSAPLRWFSLSNFHDFRGKGSENQSLLPAQRNQYIVHGMGPWVCE